MKDTFYINCIAVDPGASADVASWLSAATYLRKASWRAGVKQKVQDQTLEMCLSVVMLINVKPIHKFPFFVVLHPYIMQSFHKVWREPALRIPETLLEMIPTVNCWVT